MKVRGEAAAGALHTGKRGRVRKQADSADLTRRGTELFSGLKAEWNVRFDDLLCPTGARTIVKTTVFRKGIFAMFDAIERKRSAEVDRFRREVDRMFQEFLDRFPVLPMTGSRRASSAPVSALRETEDEFTMTAELPGMRAEDVEVSLAGRTITINARKQEEKEESGEFVRRQERSYESLTHSLELPAAVDVEGIRATFDGRVLEIRLPKARRNRIQIIPK